MTPRILLGASLAVLPIAVQAESFKCTGPDGKVVYGDTRCEGGILKAPQAAGTPATAGPRRYELTAGDRDRIKALEDEGSRPGTTAERKTAAQLEISAIRSGQDARMSAEDRQKREAINACLVDKDPAKRRQALADLRDLYSH